MPRRTSIWSPRSGKATRASGADRVSSEWGEQARLGLDPPERIEDEARATQ